MTSLVKSRDKILGNNEKLTGDPLRLIGKFADFRSVCILSSCCKFWQNIFSNTFLKTNEQYKILQTLSAGKCSETFGPRIENYEIAFRNLSNNTLSIRPYHLIMSSFYSVCNSFFKRTERFLFYFVPPKTLIVEGLSTGHRLNINFNIGNEIRDVFEYNEDQLLIITQHRFILYDLKNRKTQEVFNPYPQAFAIYKIQDTLFSVIANSYIFCTNLLNFNLNKDCCRLFYRAQQSISCACNGRNLFVHTENDTITCYTNSRDHNVVWSRKLPFSLNRPFFKLNDHETSMLILNRADEKINPDSIYVYDIETQNHAKLQGLKNSYVQNLTVLRNNTLVSFSNEKDPKDENPLMVWDAKTGNLISKVKKIFNISTFQVVPNSGFIFSKHVKIKSLCGYREKQQYCFIPYDRKQVWTLCLLEQI